MAVLFGKGKVKLGGAVCSYSLCFDLQKKVCETVCLNDDKCVASVFSDYFSMCWFLYVHPSKVYNGYDVSLCAERRLRWP